MNEQAKPDCVDDCALFFILGGKYKDMNFKLSSRKKIYSDNIIEGLLEVMFKSHTKRRFFSILMNVELNQHFLVKDVLLVCA